MANEQTRITLFVTGEAPRSQRARHNLEQALTELGIAREAVQTVDVFESPADALQNGVVAAPALLLRRPAGEISALYGDLTDADRLRSFLTPVASAAPVSGETRQETS